VSQPSQLVLDENFTLHSEHLNETDTPNNISTTKEIHKFFAQPHYEKRNLKAVDP
jgi:hypothetical protein